MTIHTGSDFVAGARLLSYTAGTESRAEQLLLIETGRLLQKHGTEFPWPGNRGGVDKVLAHLDKEAHADDADAAAAIEALLGKCGASREAQTRNGRAIRTARPAGDQVPRLVAEFQNSSKIWS